MFHWYFISLPQLETQVEIFEKLKESIQVVCAPGGSQVTPSSREYLLLEEGEGVMELAEDWNTRAAIWRETMDGRAWRRPQSFQEYGSKTFV